MPLLLRAVACGLACADYLAYMIDHEQNVAAVLIEPIVGTNGVLVPPAEYLPKLAAPNLTRHSRKTASVCSARKI